MFAATVSLTERRWHALLVLLAGLVLTLLLGGCASAPNRHPEDPIEPFNRRMQRLNDNLDQGILKPVATRYQQWVPEPVRTGANNFFGNLNDGWAFVNGVLQLRPQMAAESLLRFSFNTVFGFGGLLDIASEMGIDRHRGDFGQTLGRWGVPSGPYLVLPLLGPSTLRDTAALPVDMSAHPLAAISPAGTRDSLYVLRIVDTRASLLQASALMEQVALDRYAFTRDTYLQLRRAQIRGRNAEDEDPPADSPSNQQ